MNKNKMTVLIAALLASALLLSGCRNGSEADWEDTLPSAVTTTSEKGVTVIEAETNPPISISVPETTTTTERSTELATTTETPKLTTSATTSSSAVSSATTVSSAETTVPTTASAQTTVSTTTSESQLTETSSVTTEVTTTVETVKREDGEYVFVKGEPIKRAYPYYTLDDNKKAAYDTIVDAIKSHSGRLRFPDDVIINGEEYVELYQLIYDFEYSIFDLDVNIRYTSSATKGNVVSAEPSYLYTAEQVDDMQKKIDDAADKIIAELKDGMSEYEIVKFFYDKLASEVEYNEKAENLRDIYGALVDKSTVCGGYAKAFSYLCSKIGIESITITGDFNETPHMWNMVKINGEWYHIDVTSGNAMNSEFPYIRYDYFCVTDDVIKKYHTIYDQPFDYPKATSEKYNYYLYNGLVAEDVQSAATLIADEIIKASETRTNAVQFVCKDDAAYNDIVYYLFDSSQRHALDIYENTYDSAKNKYNLESIQYHNDPQTRVIKLFLQYT